MTDLEVGSMLVKLVDEPKQEGYEGRYSHSRHERRCHHVSLHPIQKRRDRVTNVLRDVVCVRASV